MQMGKLIIDKDHEYFEIVLIKLRSLPAPINFPDQDQ